MENKYDWCPKVLYKTEARPFKHKGKLTPETYKKFHNRLKDARRSKKAAKRRHGIKLDITRIRFAEPIPFIQEEKRVW